MTDKEFRQTLFICTPMVVCFLLFPAFCLITILFGYVWAGVIVMEVISGAIIAPCLLRARCFWRDIVSMQQKNACSLRR